MNVTLFKKPNSSCKRVDLDEVVNMMREESKAKKAIQCRNDLLTCGRDFNYPERMKPPMAIFGVWMRKEKGEVVLKKYDGAVLLEVNSLSGEAEVHRLRKLAAASPQTLLAFKGLSGYSLKILVPFSLPGGRLPEKKADILRFHTYAYRQAVMFYRMQLGVEFEPKESLPESGCRLSYDPELYYNPNALAITMEMPVQISEEQTWNESKQQNKAPLERLLPGYELMKRTSFLFEVSLKETLRYFGGLRNGDEKDFLIHLAENCCRSGIPEDDVIRWAMFYSQLKEFKYELVDTVRNVYLMRKDYGLNPSIKGVQRMSLLMEEFMSSHYEFRRNELKQEVEYRKRGSFVYRFQPVTEEVLNSISLDAHAEGLDFWDKDVRRYIRSTRIPVHNPINHYMDNLPKWDGVDHIRMLARTIPTDNPQWADYFYRWLLGVVAQWLQMKGMYAQSVVPMLSGKQGTRKSSWCHQLLPKELQEFYLNRLDFSNKRDTELSLNHYLMICLDEFDSITSHQQPYLKHLLQKPEISTRRPYKISTQTLRRYAAFIGTCNNSDMLTDPTGSRRFLCINIIGEIPERLSINHAQLYAQAKEALLDGERHWFNREEEMLITATNKAFEQLSVEEQILRSYLAAGNPECGNGKWMYSIEIIQHLRSISKIRFSSTNISLFGRILNKNNYPNRHTKLGSMYYVMIKKQ